MWNVQPGRDAKSMQIPPRGRWPCGRRTSQQLGSETKHSYDQGTARCACAPHSAAVGNDWELRRRTHTSVCSTVGFAGPAHSTTSEQMLSPHPVWRGSPGLRALMCLAPLLAQEVAGCPRTWTGQGLAGELGPGGPCESPGHDNWPSPVHSPYTDLAWLALSYLWSTCSDICIR